jgi:putative DNA methylase
MSKEAGSSMQNPEPYRKKLIEVALPLNAISEASVREKSIRHGHPSTLHLWWSRKPLATCRAVLFASLVDDPSEHPEQFPTEADQDAERQRLFQLMEKLIKWENSNNQDILAQARAEIQKSIGDKLPTFLDPFAGGGSIPLEAQRLGLETHASDLNPVAVLIEKALIEIPPKFANRPPISLQDNQLFKNQKNDWKGAHGLAEDIRYYGKWMRDEAEMRIGHLYPKATLPDGSQATVIAWLWVRTVTCPNPACGAQMPLTSKWWLSKKKGKETWIDPVVNQATTPPQGL